METSTARAVNDPAADFYIDALNKLTDTGIPFLIGGAFAFSHYSHVPRDTKDIDIFVKPDDCPRVLEAFERLGYKTDVPFPHWLGKIHAGEYFMDVISTRAMASRVSTISVRPCAEDQRLRHRRCLRPGNDLVEVLHPGARALRRRGRAPSAP
jgi:hypothetical protein